MEEAFVYLSAVTFFLSLFPFHIYGYIYVSTEIGYASLNLAVFKKITVFNINTVKNSFRKMMVNGRETDMDAKNLTPKIIKILHKLHITKIVQLGDYGLGNDGNVGVVLMQHTLTNALTTAVKSGGGRCKLKNYTVLNYEHGYINYYMKTVTVINFVTIAEILTILLTKKIK